ncbi:RNA-binding protein 44 isoform X2 [Eleginops maclovinus]|uniref:RNA-binding protein 44 isoform X2 n=1 Tax=Eleginops maclovinus TaxID=56733 RepID=UPI0030803DFF
MASQQKFRDAYVPNGYCAHTLIYLAPSGWNLAFDKPCHIGNRLFLLNRSVFDLVKSSNYLELTDPKLLQWYLCLTLYDRLIIQDIGGFQWFLLRHPALEMSHHHVYVKFENLPARPTKTSNGPTHVSTPATAIATTSRTDLEMLLNVRGPLTPLGCRSSGNESKKHQPEETRLAKPQDGYRTAFSSPVSQGSSQPYEHIPLWARSSRLAVHKDPATLTNFSLDKDLERSQQWGKPELESQMLSSQGQSFHYTYVEVSRSQSEWPNMETDSPEYYSMDSFQRDGETEYNDRSFIQSGEQTHPPLVEDTSTKEGCAEHTMYGKKNPADESNESMSRFEDQSSTFHTIMEKDESIVACEAVEDMQARNNGLHSADGEAQAATSDILKSLMKTAEKYIPSTPQVLTCDAMVGTELPPCTSDSTQTKGPEAADKNVNTEVQIADLDCLILAFIKLKEKEKSWSCKQRKECECLQRAQRAELSLLALQYSMCRQHCSGLYYTSTEGGPPPSNNPPANVASVLQKLESDYKAMRDQILAGVPLEQLKPLSVDSEEITTGGRYIPAQMVGDVLGNDPSGISQEGSSPREDPGCPDDQIRSDSQSNNKEKQMKENSTAKKAVTLVPQERDATYNAHNPEEKQTTAACTDVSKGEVWFDAEEDLQPAAAAGTGQDETNGEGSGIEASGSREVESSVLYVSNLPSNTTESDVMLWFEKYHASEVRISALKKDLRVAIVMISGAQCAEAAVRELDGCSVHGHFLRVEHINRARDESQSQNQASGTVRGPESAKTQTSESDGSRAERKPPLSSSLRNRKVLSISPTGKGTFVPQHYGTMGGFDTLMTELTQRHPGVPRQRFVDALLELKVKHKGVLSGLPLRIIREMTSELLTGAESATPR